MAKHTDKKENDKIGEKANQVARILGANVAKPIIFFFFLNEKSCNNV